MAYRSRVQLVRGTVNGIGIVVIPLTAWAILSQNVDITIAETISEWNLSELSGYLQLEIRHTVIGSSKS